MRRIPARPVRRIVLACSGDLVTSVAIPWLTEQYGAEVVTVTVDLGQSDALDDVRARAQAAGAVRAHVIDAREEFAERFLLPALQSCALDDDRQAVAVSLARLLVARHLVATAVLEEADAVAHGAAESGASDGLARMIHALHPAVRVLAPAREWSLTRPAQIAYARTSDIPVLEPLSRPVAFSSNLWGRSAWRTDESDVAVWPMPSSRTASRAPVMPAVVAIRFDRGVPVAINDVELPLVDLIASLATIAGAHGVGRLTDVPLGAAAERIAVDAPAAAVLRTASRELRAVVWPSRVASRLATEYAGIIVNGGWFAPARDALDSRLTSARRHLTGTIRLELFKGACRVVACEVATVNAGALIADNDCVSRGAMPARA
jgi:argininosuccinate synthase